MIRPARTADLETLARLRHELWPEGPHEEHAGELADFFAGRAREPLAILVAEPSTGAVAGFCELSIRAYAEGCRSDRVGYLEGWYVVPEHRHQGVGRALIEAGEEWAREQGCTEFASDAAVDNETSIRAHRAVGFDDAGVVRCFRKDLVPRIGEDNRGGPVSARGASAT